MLVGAYIYKNFCCTSLSVSHFTHSERVLRRIQQQEVWTETYRRAHHAYIHKSLVPWGCNIQYIQWQCLAHCRASPSHTGFMYVCMMCACVYVCLHVSVHISCCLIFLRILCECLVAISRLSKICERSQIGSSDAMPLLATAGDSVGQALTVGVAAQVLAAQARVAISAVWIC